MNYTAQERPLRMTFRRYLTVLEGAGIELAGRTLLDVGCGYGFFLDEARRRGADVHGVDVSPTAIDWMGTHLGIDGTVGRLERAPAGPYDLIVVSETIEHVARPDAFLGELSRRMHPQSRLVLVTGRADASLARRLGRWWWYLSPPDHCIVYSAAGLRHVLERADLEVVATRRFGFHWVGLNNGMVKVARVLQQRWLRSIAAHVPTILVPIPHGTTQIAIAKPGRVAQDRPGVADLRHGVRPSLADTT